MAHVLRGYEPRAIFDFFEDISAVPRGSGNEKGIADHLAAFAEARGLEVYRDENNNVLIKKKAAPGFEDHGAVILQAHTDMVCEKLEGVEHDFTKDPLRLHAEDGVLRAEGTTLGADDGVGVAYMMALLDDRDLPAPALECLFTAAEETGMDGARNFDYSRLSGKTLLNLDTGSFLQPVVSCAGSARAEILVPMKRSPNDFPALKLSVAGLAGGHSGGDIHRGRANADLLLARLLLTLSGEAPFALHSFEGGGKTNAIPREARAVIAVPDAPAAEERLKTAFKTVCGELTPEDRNATFTVERTQADDAFSRRDTRVLLETLAVLPDGVQTLAPSDRNLVESSSNLGIVRTEADGVRLILHARSSSESRMDELLLRFRALASLAGARYTVGKRYPGWEYAAESRLREVYAAVLKKVTGEDVRFRAVHVGLECGVIREKLGGADVVSLGPDRTGIHTPGEVLYLESFAACYAFVKELLAAL